MLSLVGSCTQQLITIIMIIVLPSSKYHTQTAIDMIVNWLLCLSLLASGTALTIGTWNVGLEEQLANQRTPAILQALTQSSPDLLCLTEVWGGPSRIRQFLRSLNYSQAITLVDSNYLASADNQLPQYQPPCQTDNELDIVTKLASCVVANCLSLTSSTLDCALLCLETTLGIDGPAITLSNCWACIIEQTYKIYSRQWPDNNPITGTAKLLDVCQQDWSQPWTQTLGLVVLSKVPLELVTIGYYPSFIIPRGYIIARIPSVNTLLTCTHLAVTTRSIPYIANFSSPYQSWTEDNEGAARLITRLLDQYITPCNSTVTSVRSDLHGRALCNITSQLLMGDFNHGPANVSEGTVAVDPVAYNIIASAGWTDLARSLPCTACSYNNIYPTNPPANYDHFWVRGSWLPNQSTGSQGPLVAPAVYRYWDQTYPINVDGHCQDYDLSDHYGILVVVNGTKPKSIIIDCSQSGHTNWSYWVIAPILFTSLAGLPLPI